MKTTLQDLREATVLVTGASGQVGWGIARAALAAGARLVLPVRGSESKQRLGDELSGANVLVSECDLGDEGSVARLRDEASERFGGVDHVAAPLGGWWQKGASLEQPPRELRELLAVYVESPWLLLKTMAPLLRKRAGSFTFFTGAAGEGFVPNGGLLVAAVNAQYALSRTLRHELASEPFRVNEIRISCRIERDARPSVVPSEDAGGDFLEVLRGDAKGQVLRYAGRGRLARTDSP